MFCPAAYISKNTSETRWQQLEKMAMGKTVRTNSCGTQPTHPLVRLIT
jgi:hypothetical protein